jgi:hypothetical protein
VLAVSVIAIVSDGALTYATFLNEDVEDLAYEAGSGGS